MGLEIGLYELGKSIIDFGSDVFKEKRESEIRYFEKVIDPIFISIKEIHSNYIDSLIVYSQYAQSIDEIDPIVIGKKIKEEIYSTEKTRVELFARINSISKINKKNILFLLAIADYAYYYTNFWPLKISESEIKYYTKQKNDINRSDLKQLIKKYEDLIKELEYHGKMQYEYWGSINMIRFSIIELFYEQTTYYELAEAKDNLLIKTESVIKELNRYFMNIELSHKALINNTYK